MFPVQRIEDDSTPLPYFFSPKETWFQRVVWLLNIKARLLFAAANLYWRLFRPLTMGVRIMLIRDDTILLVKHTYQPDWFLPGGGVRRNETLPAVARREAWEEVGAKLGELHFFGIYTNLLPEKSDHITLFVCHDYEIKGTPDFEIESVQAFPLDRLPADISVGSRRRIEEFIHGDHQPGVSMW